VAKVTAGGQEALMFTALNEFDLLFTLALSALLIGPILLYLTGPWRDRRDEILGGLSADAVAIYLRTFYASGLTEATEGQGRRRARASNHGRHGQAGDVLLESLRRMYLRRFGWRRYAGPLVVLGLVAIGMLLLVSRTLHGALGYQALTVATLPPIAVAALAGAYVWVVADLIDRWRSRDLTPANVWSSSLRLVIAVPMGMAVAAIVVPTLGMAIAFFLGAFPTQTLTTMARRIMERKTELGSFGREAKESQLEKIQGVSPDIAERLADEGVSTIVQLAYADPIELTMRCSSFAFSFVIDCASQALAWIYLEDQLPKLRPYSLRGAQEITSMVSDLAGTDPRAAERARAVLEACASVLGLKPPELEHTLRQISEDPYTEFMSAVWQQPGEEEEELTTV
jgi:hypothetical protein